MKKVVIDDRLFLLSSLFISLSSTQFMLSSINVVQPPNNNNVVCIFFSWNQDVHPMTFLDI